MKSNLKLAAVPSVRSPAREELRAAIEARAAAAARLERVKKAEDALSSKIYAAVPAIAAAEAKVAEAKEKAPAFIVAQVLGEANDADAPISTKQAQEELRLAQDDLENLRRAREAIKQELAECEQDVRHAEWKLRERIGDAVAADNAVLALLDRFAAAAREFLGTRKALEMLSERGALPEGTRWLQHAYEDVGDEIYILWQAALTALETDADALLPSS